MNLQRNIYIFLLSILILILGVLLNPDFILAQSCSVCQSSCYPSYGGSPDCPGSSAYYCIELYKEDPGGSCGQDSCGGSSQIVCSCKDCGAGGLAGVPHYAYFFLDTDGDGYHDEGESTLGQNKAYANFYSACKEEDGPWHSDSFLERINDSKIEGRYSEGESDVWASFATFGLTLNAAYYGCGTVVYTLPQTKRDSLYVAGGVRFKDYDGTSRPLHRYEQRNDDNDERCANDDSRLTLKKAGFRSDFKGEKDLVDGQTGIDVPGRTGALVQVAEFNVDYTGKYYIFDIKGAGSRAMIAPKVKEVNMVSNPPSVIAREQAGWNTYQADSSYGSLTSKIKQLSGYCYTSGSGYGCSEGVATDDQKYYSRAKSTDFGGNIGDVAWPAFGDITSTANGVFPGGVSNIKDITVWSEPRKFSNDDLNKPCSASFQCVTTNNNQIFCRKREPDHWYSQSCNFNPWSSFSSAGADLPAGWTNLGPIGSVGNIQSRDVFCSLYNCKDRVFTKDGRVYEKTASRTLRKICPGFAENCADWEIINYVFQWSWGGWTNVTSQYQSELGAAGITLNNVEDGDKMCVDVANYDWNWKIAYCKDTISTKDGRVFTKEYKVLPEWYDVGAGEVICTGGYQSNPASCQLDKNETYLMILYAATDVNDSCFTYAARTGYPFLWWSGGQEYGSPDGDSWYKNNHTAVLPVSGVINTGTITGQVFETSEPPGNCSTATPITTSDWTVTCEGVEARQDSTSTFTCLNSSGSEDLDFGTYWLAIEPGDGWTFSCVPDGSSVTINEGSQEGSLRFVLSNTKEAWYQTQGGDIHADGGSITSVIPSTCIGACRPYLMLNETISGQSGMASWQTGSVSLGEDVTYPDNLAQDTNDWRAIAGSYSGIEYNYDFWNYLLGDEEGIEEITGGSANLSTLGSTEEAKIYETTTDTLNIEGDIDSGKKVIILHSGNTLGITGDVTVDEGSFLMVITSGDIDVADDVENLQGIFIADGTVNFGADSNDTALVVEGSLIGWTNIDLSGRDLGAGNNTQPALKFIYRPDLIIEAPDVIRRPQYTWQEINP